MFPPKRPSPFVPLLRLIVVVTRLHDEHLVDDVHHFGALLDGDSAAAFAKQDTRASDLPILPPKDLTITTTSEDEQATDVRLVGNEW